MTTPMSVEERRRLASQPVTLDGKPAIIIGVQREHAIVRSSDGYSFEWAWPTVEHVVTHKNGAFKS